MVQWVLEIRRSPVEGTDKRVRGREGGEGTAYLAASGLTQLAGLELGGDESNFVHAVRTLITGSRELYW